CQWSWVLISSQSRWYFWTVHGEFCERFPGLCPDRLRLRGCAFVRQPLLGRRVCPPRRARRRNGRRDPHSRAGEGMTASGLSCGETSHEYNGGGTVEHHGWLRGEQEDRRCLPHFPE